MSGGGSNEQGALPGWAIAFADGLTLVGKLSESPGPRSRLSPVYALQVQARQTGPDQVSFHHVAMPLLMLPSIDALDLPPGCPLVRVESLSAEDRAAIARAVAGGEAMLLQLRTSQLGILAATGREKLPPPPG